VAEQPLASALRVLALRALDPETLGGPSFPEGAISDGQ
jgi:hypothetical protein